MARSAGGGEDFAPGQQRVQDGGVPVAPGPAPIASVAHGLTCPPVPSPLLTSTLPSQGLGYGGEASLPLPHQPAQIMAQSQAAAQICAADHAFAKTLRPPAAMEGHSIYPRHDEHHEHDPDLEDIELRESGAGLTALTTVSQVSFGDWLRSLGRDAGRMTLPLTLMPGTLIATAEGEVPIEDIGQGDLVLTRDHGYQPVFWAGKLSCSLAGAAALQPCRKPPILIRAGSLGSNGPDRDLMVAQGHHLLFSGYRAELLFGEYEVLVAAEDLLACPGVMRLSNYQRPYVHLLLRGHEILRCNGAWGESCQPKYSVQRAASKNKVGKAPAAQGPFAGGLMGPEGFNGPDFTAARLCLNSKEALLLFGGA